MKNDFATLERAIAYCKGQALVEPLGVRGKAYNAGVAAAVRMLEDMLPARPRRAPRRTS